MKSIFSFVLLYSALSWAQTEKPSFAVVKDIQIDGSGCEAGSANALMTDDLNYLSVLYDNFSAEIGEGTAKPQGNMAEKKCVINVSLEIPAGWNFRFDSVEYNGFVALPDRDSFAYQLVSVDVAGAPGLAVDQTLMRGPRTDNFRNVVRNKNAVGLNLDAVKLGQVFGIPGGLRDLRQQIRDNKQEPGKPGSGTGWFGCSDQVQETRVKIKSIIGIRNLEKGPQKPTAKITIDSTDAKFKQKLKMNWKRCRNL